MKRIALLSPLKHRPYQLLFAGQVISNLGDWLDYLAIIVIIVYQWHLGAPALAAFTTVTFLPLIVIAPFAGVWVDRWSSHRSMMIICDLIRAVLVLGLLWAPNIYIVLLIVAVKITASTFFNPAQQAVIRSTVPEDELLSANALSQLSLQATKILGPALGGLIVLIGGSHAAFVGDALSFLASAIILSRLPALFAAISTTQEQEKQHFWQEFRAGLSYILGQRLLVVSISSVAAALFIVFTFDSLGPLAIQALGLNSSVLGLAIGSVGLGTAIGAIVIGEGGQNISPLKVMATGNIVAGVMVALVGSAALIHLRPAGAIEIVVAVIIWFVMGVAAAAMVVPYEFILQKETPPDFMGRVVATASGFQTAVQFLAPLIGAVIAVTFGVGVVFAIAGVVLALLGTFLLFIRIKTQVPSSDVSVSPAEVEAKVS